MLGDRIDKELKEAIRQKDSIKTSTLRLLKSEIHNYIIEKRLKELKDEDVYVILQKQIKQRQDSIEQFKRGGRYDLVQKEQKEFQILKTYVPKQLSEEELKSIIKEVIQELQAKDKKDFGRVIKVVMEKTKGRVDGKAVSKLVNELLAAE